MREANRSVRIASPMDQIHMGEHSPSNLFLIMKTLFKKLKICWKILILNLYAFFVVNVN